MHSLDIVVLTVLAFGSLQSFGIVFPLATKGHHYLALWVALFAIEIASKIAMQVGVAQPLAQWFGFWLSFDLLYGPLLFLWVQHILHPHRKPWQLLHLVPAAVVLAITLSRVMTMGSNGRSEWIQQVLLAGQWQPIVSWLDTLQSFTMMHPLLYTLLTLWLLINYRKRFNQNRSESLSVRLDWLLSMVGLQMIMWPVAIYFIAYLPLPTATAWLASYIPAVIWINVLAAISLYHHNIVIGNQATIDQASDICFSSKSDKQIDQDIAKQLDKFVAQEKYRQAKLTLDELAEAIDTPSYLVSQYINHTLANNFFDYINTHRIEWVKQQLANPNSNKTILEIAFAAGFNSKSTFNTVFKKQAGCTPSQFRTNHSMRLQT